IEYTYLNNLEFIGIVALISIGAGFLGSLTGLGGGVVVTPALALLLHVDLRYAIGASLISVIATSSGAASAYVREGFSNIGIGMFLEIATTIGAIGGAYLSTRMPVQSLTIVFGFVSLYSAYQSLTPEPPPRPDLRPVPLAVHLQLRGSYPASEGRQEYSAQRIKTGFAMMLGAGVLSGLLGIGS